MFRRRLKKIPNINNKNSPVNDGNTQFLLVISKQTTFVTREGNTFFIGIGKGPTDIRKIPAFIRNKWKRFAKEELPDDIQVYWRGETFDKKDISGI